METDATPTAKSRTASSVQVDHQLALTLAAKSVVTASTWDRCSAMMATLLAETVAPQAVRLSPAGHVGAATATNLTLARISAVME